MSTIDVDALRREVAQVDWWHCINLGNGIVTPGRGGSEDRISPVRMPADLSGKTVLDIGTWDGMFSFEAERRGAERIVAVDRMQHPGFPVAKKALQSKVEFVQMDLMEMTPERIGTFDLVIFMGVIYHLPNPVEGLRRAAEVTKEMMILETDSALNWTSIPAAEFRGSREGLTSAAPNWWIPNVACLRGMIDAVGFSRCEMVYGPPPPPKSLPRKLLGKVAPRSFPPPANQRVIMHAWK